MSLTFVLTSLVIVATPGTGAWYMIAAGLSRGARASMIAALKEPDPSSELGRDVHHLLAGLEQPLSKRPPSAVGALDRRGKASRRHASPCSRPGSK